jgi:hypothetical protein
VFNFAQCAVCGHRWEIPGKRPNFKVKCDSCKAVREERIQYGESYCLPWGGDFDQYNRPMIDGHLYLPGLRTCGHLDCVLVSHVVAFQSKIS